LTKHVTVLYNIQNKLLPLREILFESLSNAFFTF